jgi:hypothetical protein
VRIFGWEFGGRAPEAKSDMSIDQLINRLDAVYETAAGITVTPENCEQSPTVKAIITAITRRF